MKRINRFLHMDELDENWVDEIFGLQGIVSVVCFCKTTELVIQNRTSHSNVNWWYKCMPLKHFHKSPEGIIVASGHLNA